jgi:hypothetical protein
MSGIGCSIVFSHLIGAGLTIGATRQSGQARTLSEKLIDAVYAVLMKITAAFRGIQRAREISDAVARPAVAT